MKAEEKFKILNIAKQMMIDQSFKEPEWAIGLDPPKLRELYLAEFDELLQFWESHQWRPKETLTDFELNEQGSVMLFTLDGTRLITAHPNSFSFTHWQPLPKGPQQTK